VKRSIPFAALLAINATSGIAQPLGAKPTLHTPDVIAPAVLPSAACRCCARPTVCR